MHLTDLNLTRICFVKMWYLLPIYFGILLLFSSSYKAQQVPKSCPLLGADYPPPSHLSDSSAIRNASDKMGEAIRSALVKETIYGRLDPNLTSFSLEVYSTSSAEALFTFHYTAPQLPRNEGVKSVDSNSVYRIASISKLFSVYTYLLAAGDASFNDPITKYVPELALFMDEHASNLQDNDIDFVDWHSITVSALASHLAGIPRDTPPAPSTESPFLALEPPSGLSINATYCGSPTQGLVPCTRAGEPFRFELISILSSNRFQV